MGCGHGASYGVAVRGTNGNARVRHSEAVARILSDALNAQTQAALAATPDTAPDTHYEDIATSADTIERIVDMHGGNVDNGEIAIEGHMIVGEDDATTRSWTINI